MKTKVLMIATSIFMILLICSDIIGSIGTAFTYQGRLLDSNTPADGLYDFQFKLFDDPDIVLGNQISCDVNVPDIDIIDGYFTVTLDFNDANLFDGNSVWLEIGVRPGDMNDPNIYTVLSPRQELTPTPYALMIRAPLRMVSDGSKPTISGIATAQYNAIGIYGEATQTDGYGVYGKATGMDSYGVYGEVTEEDSVAIFGKASGQAHDAVFGQHVDAKVTGCLGSRYHGAGVYGGAGNPDNYAGYFEGGKNYFEGNVGIGKTNPSYKLEVEDNSTNSVVYAKNSGSGIGVTGDSQEASGVYGYSYSGHGISGVTIEGYAGYFVGKVHITGALTKASGSFKIDHPLDPENKYLQHSFVESPDMMNIYNGNATLDENGQAVVQLPEYFESLNCDFRYQLTPIGAPGPNLYIAEKISENHFKIAGGKSGMEVSWQVTGIRQDPYAVANRIQVEEDKSDEERGYYLHPKAYGFTEEKGIDRLHNPEMIEQVKAQESGVSNEEI